MDAIGYNAQLMHEPIGVESVGWQHIKRISPAPGMVRRP